MRNVPKVCQICMGQGMWSCEQFKKLDIYQKWDFFRQSKLCLHCVGSGHFGLSCKRTRPCNIDWCTETHHSLLYIWNRNVNQNTDMFNMFHLHQCWTGMFHNVVNLKELWYLIRQFGLWKTCGMRKSVNQDRTLTCQWRRGTIHCFADHSSHR